MTKEVSVPPVLEEWIRQGAEQYAGPVECPAREEPAAADDEKERPARAAARADGGDERGEAAEPNPAASQALLRF